MIRHYELLKDSIEFKKGTIFVEERDDGDQNFIPLNKKDIIPNDINFAPAFSQNTVTTQSEWFREIKPLWLSPAEITKVKKLLKGK